MFASALLPCFELQEAEQANKKPLEDVFLCEKVCLSVFLSHLHSLTSLLCICQQLDGDGPAVLHSVL